MRRNVNLIARDVSTWTAEDQRDISVVHPAMLRIHPGLVNDIIKFCEYTGHKHILQRS